MVFQLGHAHRQPGADGVLIGGCHPNDCHYAEGNYKMLRRSRLLKRMLTDLGVEEERFRLEWISAAEGEKVKTVVNDMVEKIQKLGPLRLPGRFQEWDGEMIELKPRAISSELRLLTPESEVVDV